MLINSNLINWYGSVPQPELFGSQFSSDSVKCRNHITKKRRSPQTNSSRSIRSSFSEQLTMINHRKPPCVISNSFPKWKERAIGKAEELFAERQNGWMSWDTMNKFHHCWLISPSTISNTWCRNISEGKIWKNCLKRWCLGRIRNSSFYSLKMLKFLNLFTTKNSYIDLAGILIRTLIKGDYNTCS